MMPAVSDNAATTLERVQESEVERHTLSTASINCILALNGFSEDATEDVKYVQIEPLARYTASIEWTLNGFVWKCDGRHSRRAW